MSVFLQGALQVRDAKGASVSREVKCTKDDGIVTLKFDKKWNKLDKLVLSPATCLSIHPIDIQHVLIKGSCVIAQKARYAVIRDIHQRRKNHEVELFVGIRIEDGVLPSLRQISEGPGKMHVPIGDLSPLLPAEGPFLFFISVVSAGNVQSYVFSAADYSSLQEWVLTLNKAVFGTLPALTAGHACLLKSGAARGVLVTDVSPGLDTSTLAVPLSTSGKSSSSPSSSSASRHTFLPVEFAQTRTIHETLIKQQVEYSVQLLQVDILDECEQTLASERYDAGTSLLHVKELQGARRLLLSVKQADRSVSHLYFVRSNTLGSFEEQLVLFATTVLQWSQGVACPLKSKPIYALKAPAAASESSRSSTNSVSYTAVPLVSELGSRV